MMHKMPADLSGVQITASAEVVPGEMTGRVRVRGPRGGLSKGRIPPKKKRTPLRGRGGNPPVQPRPRPSLAVARARVAASAEIASAEAANTAPRPVAIRRDPIAGECVTVSFSMSLADYDALVARAKAAGVERSTLIRRLIHRGEIK